MPNWFLALLCRVGFHGWEYGFQNIPLVDGTIHKGHDARRCRRCPAKQWNLYEKDQDRVQWIRSK